MTTYQLRLQINNNHTPLIENFTTRKLAKAQAEKYTSLFTKDGYPQMTWSITPVETTITLSEKHGGWLDRKLFDIWLWLHHKKWNKNDTYYHHVYAGGDIVDTLGYHGDHGRFTSSYTCEMYSRYSFRLPMGWNLVLYSGPYDCISLEKRYGK